MRSLTKFAPNTIIYGMLNVSNDNVSLNKLKLRLSYTRIIVLGYLLIILAGGLLLTLPAASADGTPTRFLDAVFTSTSATCVTGLVVYDTFTHWSVFGQLVILALIQVGGLGFMTVITLFSISIGKSLSLHERRLFMQSTGNEGVGGAVRLIRRIAFGTLIIELTGAVLLATRFIPKFGVGTGIYYAIFHSVSAFCNAGFDLMGRLQPYSSLIDFAGDPVVIVTITLLIVIGGIGFWVWNDIRTYGLHVDRYPLHTKLVLSITAVLIFGGAVIFFFTEGDASFAGMSTGERILAALFQSVTPRTAGFNSVDQAKLSGAGFLITIFLMFIGGSPGSTAGGVKTTTFAVLILSALSSSRRSNSVNVFKRRLEDNTLREAASIVTLYILAIISGVFIICASQPELPLMNVIYEAVSAIATVGLSTGITSALGTVSRIAIIILMYGGRVGILSLAVSFAEKHENVPVTRPSEKIFIG